VDGVGLSDRSILDRVPSALQERLWWLVGSWRATVEAVAAELAPAAAGALTLFGKRPATNCDGLVSALKCGAHQQKFRWRCTGEDVQNLRHLHRERTSGIVSVLFFSLQCDSVLSIGQPSSDYAAAAAAAAAATALAI